MLTPTTSSTTPAAGTSKGGSADSLLPAAGRELAATVRSVAASGGNAAVFRIQVEVNSRLLELTTQAPLAQGDRIVLQRGNTGELQIRLPAPAQPNVQGNTTPAAQSSMTLQLTSSDGARLQQLLPLNVPRNAQVTGSEPLIPRQPAAATSPQPGAGATPAETSAKPAAAYPQPPGGNTSQGATQGNAPATSGNNSPLQGQTQPTSNAPTPARSESPAAQAISGSRQPAGVADPQLQLGTGAAPAETAARPTTDSIQPSPGGNVSQGATRGNAPATSMNNSSLQGRTQPTGNAPTPARSESPAAQATSGSRQSAGVANPQPQLGTGTAPAETATKPTADSPQPPPGGNVSQRANAAATSGNNSPLRGQTQPTGNAPTPARSESPAAQATIIGSRQPDSVANTQPQPGTGTAPAETAAKPTAAYPQPTGGNTSQGATQGNAPATSGNNSPLQGRTQPTGNAPTPARSESPAAQATSGSRQSAGVTNPQPQLGTGTGAGTAETAAKPTAADPQPPGGNTSQGATQGNAATTSGNNSSLQGRTQPTGNAPTPARSESPAAQATSGSRQPASAVTGQPPSSATPSSQATQMSPSGTISSQVQVYSAQLQSSAVSQVSTATSATTPTNQPPAAQTQTAGSEARPVAPAPTTQATSPDTAAKTQTAPADSTARASTSASPAVQTAQTTTQPSVSHTGQALLQTLGKQVPVQADNHMIRLNLNNQTLNLISPKPLLSGQQVVLTRVSEQLVNLQPVPVPTAPSQEATAQLQMQLALREALPRQIPFGDALNQLVQLSQSPAGRSQGAIGQLVQSMLSMFSVSPGSADAEQAIQRNLQQGGLLTESRLAQGGGTERGATPDLKQQLGQLLKAAEQLPPDARQQMTRLVDALQARSTTQQVSSLQGWKDQPDGTQERVYRLDLPIRQADQHDNAELTITEQRRRSSGGEVETLWGVALHFDLEQHGSVDARLSLSEEWRLQVQLWAEQASTLRQIERRLDDFSDGLHRKGFLVETLQARQGRPSQPELTDVQRRLVDVHT
ncbi:hypothetical protein ABIE61_002461 [Marinobacterium sp. MBR-111]|uniref:flagellar hook-length control protein FliK n=1 Tax=Marinobacterium sp. MBR-111 TaxID=3156463 RepID=UPI003394884A